MDQNLFYLRPVVLINILCSVSTFTRVNMRGWGWDGGIFCGDGVGTGTGTGVTGTEWGWGRGCGDWGWGGDGYSVHGDGRGWGQILSPCRPLA